MLTLSYATHRSCVGRNLANLELLVIVASIFRRYHFVLEDPDMEVRPLTRSIAPTITAIYPPLSQLATREGFLRKPVECKVGMRRRQV